MTLDSQFGWVDVNGKKFDYDVIIHCDGAVTKRKKKKSKALKPQYGGHTPLSKPELNFLSKEKFDALYVGKGHLESLPITPKACKVLEQCNAVILSTPQVIERINQERRPFVAIIHSTCWGAKIKGKWWCRGQGLNMRRLGLQPSALPGWATSAHFLGYPIKNEPRRFKGFWWIKPYLDA